MPIRFSSPQRRDTRSSSSSARVEGFGEWWAAIAVIALATTAIVALSNASNESGPPAVSPAPAPAMKAAQPDRSADLLAAIDPAIQSLDAVESAFALLCREPVLQALELAPDCETGVITLGDNLFGEFGDSALVPELREDVSAAMTTYLERLRRLPALWDRLEAIEIRGHSDPRAFRNPYSTNLVGSQQRALAVLLFLVGPDGGLSEADIEVLQRLATVSGASFSRPPASCPEQTRSCYPEWRRVEVRPVLSEPLRREDWARTVESIQIATEGNRAEAETQVR